MRIRILQAWDRVTTKTLLGILISFGLFASPATAQVSETQVNALVEALRRAAPLNSPDDGMYSEWQVLPGIIPGWSQQCTGQSVTPEQFEADPTIARSVVSCIAQWQLEEQLNAVGNDETMAVGRAACWWMTGEASGCDSDATADYVENVLGSYQQQLNLEER